ncbi:uncharacterized protein [Littorina saxatilis]|uniref:uncharacterized protein n=1 Tax=Littorina saxatilis TaxID=31220 RepID=UPI0038B54C11
MTSEGLHHCTSLLQTVWQTKKLLTSIDAVAISPPPEEDNQAFALPGSTWLHLDQSSNRRGLHCYQGAVNLEESSDTDYCFRVLEGSHKHTDAFYDEHDAAANHSVKFDFFKLRDEHITWFKKEHGCRLTKVPVPKGGMVLWDSRTVHDNCRPEHGRPNSDRWRFVVFVCMGPARWATVKDLAQKRQAYKTMRMTSHWPVQNVTTFPERAASDATSGVPLLKKLPEAARSEEARMLAGVLEYDFEDGEPDGPAWDPEWRQQ